jgi:hypothetical protein
MDVVSAAAGRERRSLHPGWLSHFAALGGLVLSAWELSAPGARLWMSLLLLTVWVGLLLYWVLGFPACVLLERRLPDRRSWLHWLAIPVTAAAALALWQTEAALQARFHVSRSVMAALTSEVIHTPSGTAIPDQRVGLYRATEIERLVDSVRFKVAGTGFGDNAGFAYSPNRAPPSSAEDTYIHLDGPWWLWHESW